MVVIEKYVSDSLLVSADQVPDFSEASYVKYRDQWLPYFEYLEAYLINCTVQFLEPSYPGYEYYAAFMRQRDV